MTNSQALVAKLYRSVIDDVINGVRDNFLDEGVDEAVLLELKQLWENKLTASKAIEPSVDPAEVALMTKLQSQGSAKGGSGSGSQSNAKAAQQAAAAAQQASQQQQPEAQPVVVSQSPAAPPPSVNQPPPVKMVPVQITVPAQAGVPSSTAKTITVQVPAHALQGGAAGAQLQAVLSSPTITSTLTLPPELAANVLQQQINAALQTSASRQAAASKGKGVTQLDGAHDSSDDEDDLDDDDDDLDDDDADKDDDEEAEEQDGEQEEEPLNSEDDVSDEDPTDLFETDNVVVCQYDKITRSRNRWKFHLKDGIMSLAGKDYVFQKANGDAEW